MIHPAELRDWVEASKDFEWVRPMGADPQIRWATARATSGAITVALAGRLTADAATAVALAVPAAAGPSPAAAAALFPLPTSTAERGAFLGYKIQCNIFCIQKTPKGLHMDPKVQQRRPFGAPRASPDLQKQAKTLVKIDVFTMCIKLALGTIFSPLGPPRGGPSDLKGAKSAEKAAIWDTILSIFSIFFCLGCKISQMEAPRTHKGAFWPHFGSLFERLLNVF